MKQRKDEDISSIPAYTLVVLQLADDLDVFAFLSEHSPDSMYVCCFADEGGEHHVHSMLQTKLQVLYVLLWNSRQVHSSTGEVHSLLAAQGATVLNLTHEEIRAWRQTWNTNELNTFVWATSVFPKPSIGSKETFMGRTLFTVCVCLSCTHQSP